MTYVYAAVFHPEPEGGYSVFFPDIDRGATQGESVAECIRMAEDFLCLALYSMEEDGSTLPRARELSEIKSNKEDIVTLIAADTELYRRLNDNRLVKKTLNIPSWLNERAMAANINFSLTLQNALKDILLMTSNE